MTHGLIQMKPLTVTQWTVWFPHLLLFLILHIFLHLHIQCQSTTPQVWWTSKSPHDPLRFLKGWERRNMRVSWLRSPKTLYFLKDEGGAEGRGTSSPLVIDISFNSKWLLHACNPFINEKYIFFLQNVSSLSFLLLLFWIKP